MSRGPRNRSRLGLAAYTGRAPDIDSYNGRPFQPYPKYERIIPRDLVQMLENNFQLLWRECAPDDIPLKYQSLKTIAHDELWESLPDNGFGNHEKQTIGEGQAPVCVRPKPAKKIEPKQTIEPTERAGLTKDQILGKDHLDPFIQKFYPDVVFNRSGSYT